MSAYNEQPDILWNNLIGGFEHELNEIIARSRTPEPDKNLGADDLNSLGTDALLNNFSFFSPPTLGNTTPNALKSVIYPCVSNGLSVKKLEYIFGDGQASSFELFHGLDTEHIIVSVSNAVTKKVLDPSIVLVDANVIRVVFATVYVPRKDSILATIVG